MGPTFLGLVCLLAPLTGCQSTDAPPASPAGGSQPAPLPSPSPTPGTVTPDPRPDPDQAPPFLAIARQVAGEDDGRGDTTALVRQMLSSAPADVFDPSGSFYLAVHRRELGKRWFLSAYLKQFFPGEVQIGAAKSLGTRVISFRVQNGKLYLFDVDDRKRTSDSFGEDQVVDAYPIVDSLTALLTVRDARALRDYVLVDPGASLNRFGVVSDAFSSGAIYEEKPFQVELKFSQRFRPLGDGVSFEQAFTGYSERPRAKKRGLPPFQEEAERVEPNLFRSSGVLGLALRRYQEGEGFESAFVPFSSPFFTSAPQLVPNQGEQRLPVARWNIRPEGKPIEWVVSPLVETMQALPDSQAAGIDLYGAIKRGIESWNVAFGFPALQVRMATAEESFADDDKNYLIWDQNPNIDGAFADFRTNPNTGEIRGASVYMNDGFRSGILELFSGGREGPPVEPVARAPRPSLTWQPFPSAPLCKLSWSSLSRLARELEMEGAASGQVKEKVEKFLAHVVAHEIGHTLGLRHNFKGSLLPPSSSVMDYVQPDVAVASEMPGAYDVDVVRYLYGLTDDGPRQPFCTDENLGLDPTCQVFDQGADPLRDHWARRYPPALRRFLDQGSIPHAIQALQMVDPLITYLQRGRAADDRVLAIKTLFGEITATTGPVPSRPPSFARGVNLFSEVVMFLLYPDPAAFEGVPEELRPPPSPPLQPDVAPLLAGELKANLLDQDGLRSFPLRRFTVDTLKRMQEVAGFQALREARATLAIPVEPSPPPEQEALLEDLRARIDAATGPYFVR